jgi:hypothetical protein
MTHSRILQIKEAQWFSRNKRNENKSIDTLKTQPFFVFKTHTSEKHWP